MSSRVAKCRVNIELLMPMHVAEGAGVKLVDDERREETILCEIDTEISVTIETIYQYIQDKFPIRNPRSVKYQLYYNDQALDNYDRTLADYGWVNGTTGTITVEKECKNKVEPTLTFPRKPFLSTTQ